MRRLLWLAVSLVGCGPADVPCNQMMMPGDLVGKAQLMRLDVFDASVHCAGATVTAGAPAPSLTQVAPAGTPIHLDIPSGHHTLLLSAFADSTGTQLIATACTETDLEAGASVCFDLSLVETPDMATDNDARATCSASPDNCPVGQYCAVDGQCAAGCKNADDCMGGSSAKLCDTAAHRCVECLVPNDCPAGKVCSPSGSCVMGCDVSAGSNCPGMQQCCSNFCIDTTTDISSCGACGRACDSTHVTTPGCAGNVCAPACANGYGDCNHPVAPNADDGCETNLHDVMHCGGCNTVCNLPNATPKCPTGTCQVQSCNTDKFDCDGTAMNGCECSGKDLGGLTPGCCSGACQTLHTNGLGGNFYDCIALGTFSEQLATDAANSYTLTNSVPTFTNTCTAGGMVVDTVFKRNALQTECVAWGFAGTVKGYVQHFASNCMCPGMGTTWQ